MYHKIIYSFLIALTLFNQYESLNYEELKEESYNKIEKFAKADLSFLVEDFEPESAINKMKQILKKFYNLDS